MSTLKDNTTILPSKNQGTRYATQYHSKGSSKSHMMNKYNLGSVFHPSMGKGGTSSPVDQGASQPVNHWAQIVSRPSFQKKDSSAQ